MTDAPRPPRPRFGLRSLYGLVIVVGLLVVGRFTGLSTYLDIESIRAALENNDPWGLPLYVALYALGAVVNVPGWLYIGVAVVAYGPVVAAVASYAGAMLGNLLLFGLFRLAGHRLLRSLESPIVQRSVQRLDAQPTTTVALLRVLFPTNVAVNATLVMAGVGFRPFVAGSLVGVVPQLLITVVAFAAALGVTDA